MTVITLSGYRKTVKWVRAVLFLGFFAVAGLLLLLGAGFLYMKLLGEPEVAVPQSTLYLAADGQVIGESHASEKRYWVDLDEISPYLVQATIAVEDKKFFKHHGFDFKRMAGAAVADIQAMAKVQGASTITQQYARNLYLSHDKTWKRKLSEAVYTARIEMNYTKEQILEGYLNTIYYGHGAYGIEAASQFYFGKSAKSLSLSEASMLAGIPKGPSIYSPLASLPKAKERQKVILAEMEKSDVITPEQREQALADRVHITGEHLHTDSDTAPYFRQAVQQVLADKLGLDEQTIALGGLRVYTTLNREHQAIAEKTIKKVIAEDSDIQPAFVSIAPKTHFVTALAGGKDFATSPYNRAVQAVRQPGSTFKPFLYYAALENGYTPATQLTSEKTAFRYDNGQKVYEPSNFNHRYANGSVTMEQALAVSDNIYAVKTNLFLKPETLVQTAERFGISTPLKPLPSLALGTSGVRVLEMVNAYATIANGGKYEEPVFIQRVETADGEIIYEHEPDKKQRLDKKQAAVLTHMMTGMFDENLSSYANVTGASLTRKITRPYAGKSGSTAYDYWMIGFTPQLAAGIWTGYDDGRKIVKAEDKHYAKDIWLGFMEGSHRGKPVKKFQKPKGVIAVNINPENGKIASSDCPVTRTMYFVKGTEPEEYCTDHLPKKKKEKEKEGQKEEGWLQRLFPLF
ncbi:transglycosylase domain-containing protein [Pseudobacillus badius]|uniref:transglycosylase domain-containing protein n=1 Tax=Bacillus badius TaxID=1455 RepID=UPI0007B064EA|nr:transglycosylase domain-containing protein [Bacillus badius]KZN99904.1 monofunctional biosynthetic peptidoglycan transglycosylase [Bacillus badius]MED0666042.1 transglycosylase domain-containing protein [Bacillus badius]OCS86074.1 monofunctional biosynthetic peptidoglycan transglycosylase [Bacillus badius]OVE52463.1 monofunctional biosynthetic peptidoglycan transglycosylase [Bacillus badius]TDW04213.1 1A family penicillin-binding protein [Bacillus badius]